LALRAKRRKCGYDIFENALASPGKFHSFLP